MLFQWNDSIVVLLNMMRRSGINECRCDSSCVPAFHEWRMNMVGECSWLHIGISTTAKSLCPSCKSQQQREGEGVDYVVLLDCIPSHIVVHTLFSADRLLLYVIGDGLHGYEWLRCVPFWILLRLSRSTCISFPSSHYCLHLPPSIQSPLYSSFSLVIVADRSLLVLLQFPLKPSMSMRTAFPSAVHLKWPLATSCWSWSCTSSTPAKTTWCLHWRPRAQ